MPTANGHRTAVCRGPLLLLALAVAACGDGGGTPEDALRAWVARGEAAAESRDRDALLDMIAAGYTDSRGHERADIDRLLRLYFLRQQSVSLLTHIENIDVVADSAALVTVTIGMAGTGHGTFGMSADAYRFEFELETDRGDWLLIGARWGELGDDLR